MKRHYLCALFAALMLQWLSAFIFVKLNQFNQVDLAKYVSFLAMTTYNGKLLFLNPPVFSVLYVAFRYYSEGGFGARGFLGLALFFLLTYAACWVAFLMSISSAGAR